MRRLLAILPRRSLRELRDRALVHFLLTSGCRISEALALDVADVARGRTIRVLGKGGKPRSVYVTAAAARDLAEYLRERGGDPCPALFIDAPGGLTPWRRGHRPRRLTAEGARRVLAELRRRFPHELAVVQLRGPHVLRHTAATLLLEATGDARLVQEVLGHARLSTILTYADVNAGRKLDAYRRLSALHRPPPEPVRLAITSPTPAATAAATVEDRARRALAGAGRFGNVTWPHFGLKRQSCLAPPRAPHP